MTAQISQLKDEITNKDQQKQQEDAKKTEIAKAIARLKTEIAQYKK